MGKFREYSTNVSNPENSIFCKKKILAPERPTNFTGPPLEYEIGAAVALRATAVAVSYYCKKNGGKGGKIDTELGD